MVKNSFNRNKNKPLALSLIEGDHQSTSKQENPGFRLTVSLR